jgi:hypothetical protein
MNYLFATKIKPFLQDRHMCVNYTPTRKEALADFGVNGQQLDDYKAETWQDYAAPIIGTVIMGNARSCWHPMA